MKRKALLLVVVMLVLGAVAFVTLSATSTQAESAAATKTPENTVTNLHLPTPPCILVDEERGTKCGSHDSLLLTLTLEDDCATESVGYTLYAKKTDKSKWEYKDSGRAFAGRETTELFCHEPHSYEIRGEDGK
jgi:hypothetical protein